MNIVPRSEWAGDIRPRGTPGKIALPTADLWLHHGASASSTVAAARSYVRYHIDHKGWVDVGYSFLIAEGKVLEGRGPGRAGAHTGGHNTTSHGVCIVGDYTKLVPHPRDLHALVDLIRYGHDEGWWRHPRLSGGHRDVSTSRCPGDALYGHIPTINRLASEPVPATVEDDMPLSDDDVMRIAKATADLLGFYDPDRKRYRSYHTDAKATREGVRKIGEAVGTPLRHPAPDENPA